MPSTRSVLELKRPAQLARVLTPQRIEILEALRHLGPSTVAELAHHLGRAADGLYHHLRCLQRDSAVERDGSRASGGRSATVYRCTTEAIEARLTPASKPAFRRAWARAAAGVLRTAERELAVGALDSRADNTGSARTVHVTRKRAWLTKAQRARFDHHVRALHRLLDEHGTRRADTAPYTWTAAFAPLPDPGDDPHA